jgi:hypothetical protein
VTGFWLQDTPPSTEIGAQPVPIGMLSPETSMPRTDSTSDDTHGLLEFSTFWQHWGPAVVEPPEPPPLVGAATARVAKLARARVKTLANMMVVSGLDEAEV